MANGSFLESQPVKVGTVFGLIGIIASTIWGFSSWAEDKHAELRALTAENARAVQEIKTSNELLKQITVQQSELIKQNAETAKTVEKTAAENAKALIRIEAKVNEIARDN